MESVEIRYTQHAAQRSTGQGFFSNPGSCAHCEVVGPGWLQEHDSYIRVLRRRQVGKQHTGQVATDV